MTVQLHLGDCLDVMRGMPDACVDAVVTDPPYGLAFMGKQWDHGVPGVEFWAEALRVAKPGAHILAFGGTRTFHRLACAIEDAGWQIKDCLSWLYGSGFPKHKTLLKPAWEPVIMAAKAGRRAVNIDACRLSPGEGIERDGERTAKDRYGARGLGFQLNPGIRGGCALGRWPANVCLDEVAATLLDGQSGDRKSTGNYPSLASGSRIQGAIYSDSGGASRFFFVSRGDECGHASIADLSSSQPSPPGDSARNDAAILGSPEGKRRGRSQVGPGSISDSESFTPSRCRASTVGAAERTDTIPTTPTCCESSGSARHAIGGATNRGDTEREVGVSVQVSGTRFLYTPKASRSEREAGLDGFEPVVRSITSGHGLGPVNTSKGGDGIRENRAARNHHPTVKPIAVMQWLVRLVTPTEGVVLDPFMGSGTTGIACVREGRSFVGIEREPEYHAIAEARIAHARGETPADAEQPALPFEARA